jgi:hypothetical protein
MDDDDPYALQVLIEWLYTNQLPTYEGEHRSEIYFNAMIADLADKYDLSDLAMAAWTKIAECTEDDQWHEFIAEDIEVLFSFEGKTNSVCQPEDMIIDDLYRRREDIIGKCGMVTFEDLLRDNPRFSWKIALKLLPATSKT